MEERGGRVGGERGGQRKEWRWRSREERNEGVYTME